MSWLTQYTAAGWQAFDFRDGGAEPWRQSALDAIEQCINSGTCALALYGVSSDGQQGSLNIAAYWIGDDATITWLQNNVPDSEPPPIVSISVTDDPAATGGTGSGGEEGEEAGKDDEKSGSGGFGLLNWLKVNLPPWLRPFSFIVLLVLFGYLWAKLRK